MKYFEDGAEITTQALYRVSAILKYVLVETPCRC